MSNKAHLYSSKRDKSKINFVGLKNPAKGPSSEEINKAIDKFLADGGEIQKFQEEFALGQADVKVPLYNSQWGKDSSSRESLQDYLGIPN
tara:strand:- start:931 stop:1200 length:270 start_codon:yes stop_codon:yes gene_type:complete